MANTRDERKYTTGKEIVNKYNNNSDNNNRKYIQYV